MTRVPKHLLATVYTLYIETKAIMDFLNAQTKQTTIYPNTLKYSIIISKSVCVFELHCNCGTFFYFLPVWLNKFTPIYFFNIFICFYVRLYTSVYGTGYLVAHIFLMVWKLKYRKTRFSWIEICFSTIKFFIPLMSGSVRVRSMY